MIKKLFNIIILLVLVLMAGLSIYGAFLGSVRAGSIAGSQLFIFPGIILIVLFILSFIRYPALLARPGLMMVHIGCAAIIAGGIWGGQWSHSLRMKDLPESHTGPARYGKVYKSFVRIDEGDYIYSLYEVDDNGVQLVTPLGFKVYLSDFELQCYDNGQVKDYISHVMIIADNGRHFGPYEIEVNKPLYFGGYHFYQHDFDHENGKYTILRVVSDDGLWLVYAGYFLLLSGIFWQFWLEPILKRSARQRGGNDDR